MTTAPAADGRAPTAGRRRPAGRRPRRLDVVVGGPGGPRSRVWTVSAPRSGAADVVVAGTGAAGPARTVHRAGRRLELPAAATGVAAPCLGAAVQSPAAGWHVGAVLVLPVPALCADPRGPVPDGARRVGPPPPGHHVQIVLLLGDDGCVPLDLPRPRDAGSLLLPGGDRLQLWSHHVPGPPPVAHPGTGGGEGVPVVVDTGAGAHQGPATDRGRLP